MNFQFCYRELIKLTCQLRKTVSILWDIVVLIYSAVPVILAVHRLSMDPEVAVAKVWPEFPAAKYGLL